MMSSMKERGEREDIGGGLVIAKMSRLVKVENERVEMRTKTALAGEGGRFCLFWMLVSQGQRSGRYEEITHDGGLVA